MKDRVQDLLMAPYEYRRVVAVLLALLAITTLCIANYIISYDLDLEMVILHWGVSIAAVAYACLIYNAYEAMARVPYRVGAWGYVETLFSRIAQEQPLARNRQILLYLHPFILDNSIYEVHPTLHAERRTRFKRRLFLPHWADFIPFGWVVGLDNTYVGKGFEVFLAREVRRFGLLVTTGRGLYDVRDMFVYPDPGRDWPRHLSRLMEEAAIIFCTLYPSPSLMWEVESIIGMGHLPKTIFIWPASGMASRPDQKQSSEFFEKIWTAFGRIGPPPIDPAKGCYLKYEPHKDAVWKVEEWGEESYPYIDSMCDDVRRGSMTK